MDQPDNPYASPPDLSSVARGECLFVEGNVNLGKDKGQGQLLLTRNSLFALRSTNQAMMMGGAMGGLVGVLIGYWIDKQRAKKRAPPQHLEDPEIKQLDDSTRKKIEQSSLLAKLPLSGLKIERTRMGFQFTADNQTVVYQSLLQKNKIAAFLATLGIDAG